MHYFLFMLESDMLGLLKPEQDEEEEFVQSAEISDYDLQSALDCEDLKREESSGLRSGQGLQADLAVEGSCSLMVHEMV
ncbi:unnamed protein product [Sphagnum balticum]